MSPEHFGHFGHAIPIPVELQHAPVPSSDRAFDALFEALQPSFIALVLASPLDHTIPPEVYSGLIHSYLCADAPSTGRPRWRGFQRTSYTGPRLLTYPQYLLNLSTYKLKQLQSLTQERSSSPDSYNPEPVNGANSRASDVGFMRGLAG